MSTARTDLSEGTRLLREFDQLRDPSPGTDALRLARLVTQQVRRSGRHHLGDGLLAAIDALHRRHLGRNAFLDAFLGAVLARRHHCFRNRTYLALPLVELVQADLGVDAELMSALLMADVVRHECRPENAARLDRRARDVRIHHAARFAATVDPALDVRWLPGEWLALSALPVSPEHDEYVFIRALQAHEMVFTTLATALREATAALRAEDVRAATAHVARADGVFGRAAMLLRLIATMRPTAWRTLRQDTEGASALRSEAYEQFQLACGTPAAERLLADAFDNDPAMRTEARPDDFTRAWHAVEHRGPDLSDLARAVHALESSHHRWRTTHHCLTAGMLGSAHGSGYTESMRHLRGCLDDPLFDLGSTAITSPRRPMVA